MASVCHQDCKQQNRRKILKRADHEAVTITEVFYHRDQEMRKHSHSLPHLGIALSDGCYHQVGTAKAERGIPGDLHYLPAGENHAFKFDSDTRCILLRINPPILAKVKDCTTGIPAKAGKQSGRTFNVIAQRVLSEVELDDDLSPLAVECLVTEALLEIHRGSRSSSKISPVVLRARELLNEGLSHPLRLGTIATQIGMHPAHLAREFRKAFHCTMSEYLRQLRVQKAKLLLPRNQITLGEVGQHCGFCDQSHFCRCFKQIVGVSPLAYKRQTRT